MFGFHLGISGAAIATVIGNAAAIAYYFVCIWRADNPLSILPKYFKLETKYTLPYGLMYANEPTSGSLFPEILSLLFRYYMRLRKCVRYQVSQSVSSLLRTWQNQKYPDFPAFL